MAKAGSRSGYVPPRRLPRGRHALTPEQVLADQRERLLTALPGVVAEHGYEAMSVADIVKRAAVSRNAFYNNFKDKQECFANAHEAGHERLFETLAGPCERGTTVEERVELSLAAGLEALASDPGMARVLFVEATSSAGEEVALRYHEWLRRYGTLLRAAAPPQGVSSSDEIDVVIVGGIASRIASVLLEGGVSALRALTPYLLEYVLAFYGPRLDPQTGTVVTLEPEQSAEQPTEYLEERRKQAGP